jgi:sigma54-dependent transcription regulator
MLAQPVPLAQAEAPGAPDLADIKGQESAKRALEVAAAGGHNLLMSGPPGAGKSMLAARVPGILPPLTPAEALEVSMIHSLAGTLADGRILRRRPFRDPHHSASLPALIGGGPRARPGEVSLAHLGVLFLDELPEFAGIRQQTHLKSYQTFPLDSICLGMADPHVLTGLIKKRAELAGEIEAAQSRLRMLVIDLDHLDATIRLFKPDIDLEDIRPKPLPPQHHAFKGEVTRIVLDTLRQSTKPMTTNELAQHVMAERGLNTADKKLVRVIGKRVGACLRHWRARGTVTARKGPGPYQVWEIVRPNG